MVESGKVTQSAKILFLKSKGTETRIIETLISDGYEVWYTDGIIEDTESFDLAISFGYRHILKGDVLHNDKCPIINLHIGFLPYNRGADPNFWSFYAGTPSGVTIHLIDEGIDTGDIFFRQAITLSNKDNEQTLLLKPLKLGAILMVKTIKTWKNGKLQPISQNKVGKLFKKKDNLYIFNKKFKSKINLIKCNI